MIDLHVHTNNSDGTHTTEEVLDMAVSAGLGAVAITDHDTVRGIREALKLGEKKGIRVIPGIEINAKYEERNTHIVGLFIDPDSKPLAEFSNDLVGRRLRRNIAMIERLQELGYNVDFDDFPDFVRGQVMTKGNFGKVLVEKGYFATTGEAIEALMEKGRPAYIPKVSCTPMEAVDVIHQAGGLAFVAHFHQICRKGIDLAEEICRRILEYGADGLETRYSEFDDTLRARAEAMAAEYGKLRSGGSDYHGSTVKPGLRIGTGYGDLYVPDEYLTAMDEYLAGRGK